MSTRSPTTVLAADVGGTNVRVALIGRRGRILARAEVPARTGVTQAGMVGILEKTARELLAGQGIRRVPPMGIGIAGGIDAARGVVTQSPQFPEWKNFALASRLSKRLQTQVRIANDVDAALLGEHRFGAARGAQTVAAWWLGTGVGGALMIGGQLYHGPSGMAGEFGHMMIDPRGERCGCGARGCLETLASARAVEREARRGKAIVLKDGARARTALQVYEAACAGDSRARKIWQRVGWALGESIGSMVNALSIDRVVIGGKVAGASRFFLPALRKSAKERAFREPGRRLQVVLSALGDDAALLGAAALAQPR